MAVISIKERHQQRRSGIDKDGKLTHSRVFLVTCDNSHDGTAVAVTAEAGTAKVPRYREANPKLDGTYVSNVSAEPLNDDDRRFLVTIEYAESDSQFDQLDPDPLRQPADISYGANDSSETYFYDWSPAPNDWNVIKDGNWKGKPLATTAGDAFEDTRERETSELIINIVTNEVAYNSLAANAYAHTINDTAQQIDGETYPEHTLKMSPITAEKVSQKVNGATVNFYKVTKVVKYRSEGWNDDIFDAGFNELDYKGGTQPPARTAEAKTKPIMSNGLKVDKPWPLDGKGRKKKNPTDAPAVLTFRPYKWMSWSDLRWS